MLKALQVQVYRLSELRAFYRSTRAKLLSSPEKAVLNIAFKVTL